MDKPVSRADEEKQLRQDAQIAVRIMGYRSVSAFVVAMLRKVIADAAKKMAVK